MLSFRCNFILIILFKTFFECVMGKNISYKINSLIIFCPINHISFSACCFCDI